MPNKIITQQVDLYTYPKKIVASSSNQLSIGDLHANCMLFLHFLVSHGVVKISEDNYKRLVKIYRKEPLTKTDIAQFNTLINTLEVDKSYLIRLIGDEICDRGQNDYFIYKLLAKLNKGGVKTEILLSNHGFDFLIPYEKNEALVAPNIGFGGQTKSLENLNLLLEKKIIQRDELDRIIKAVYLPNLKLISWALTADDTITLFSHAPVGLEIVAELCGKFNIPYKDKTAKELAQTLDLINVEFQKYINTSRIHELIPDISDMSNPIARVIWNRDYAALNRAAQHNGYNIFYVHGHDSSQKTKDNVYNLDDVLGKRHHDIENNQGEMRILASEGVAPELTEVIRYEEEIVTPNDKIALAEEEKKKKQFENLLKDLEIKADDLQGRGHKKAYNTAMKLHKNLTDAFNRYLNDGDYEQFDESVCDKQNGFIAQARPVLERHRGWSQFLTNLALAIPLCVPLLIKGVITSLMGRSFFFVHHTKSGKLLNEIEQAVTNKPDKST